MHSLKEGARKINRCHVTKPMINEHRHNELSCNHFLSKAINYVYMIALVQNIYQQVEFSVLIQFLISKHFRT